VTLSNYGHTTELLDFLDAPAIPRVPCPLDSRFHKSDKSVSYKLVCLMTANVGMGHSNLLGKASTCVNNYKAQISAIMEQPPPDAAISVRYQ
jgi:hypothetical protein